MSLLNMLSSLFLIKLKLNEPLLFMLTQTPDNGAFIWTLINCKQDVVFLSPLRVCERVR